ncbi:hypothetical protein [Chitinophaga rhizophila]|uniref:Uncharacterized protein n=1 Tax=Chitinophaga rhizophila TaxID=2866212 RepID=A0ABS7GIJ4_9BACT|nr:hypothetical protein [Chitinophaga rhizophila]MBW8687231.1 hypothetical protein [Chitinophaga rhizophila]
MGSFNILLADVTCSVCKKQYEGRIQFKYGNVSFREFRVGDSIMWGGNQIGSPDAKKVKVYGILEVELCPICGQVNVDEEFDLYVINDLITNILPIEDITCYLDEGTSEYVVQEA